MGMLSATILWFATMKVSHSMWFPHKDSDRILAQ